MTGDHGGLVSGDVSGILLKVYPKEPKLSPTCPCLCLWPSPSLVLVFLDRNLRAVSRASQNECPRRNACFVCEAAAGSGFLVSTFSACLRQGCVFNVE